MNTFGDVGMNEVITGKALGLTTVRGGLLVPKEIAPFLRVSERWIQEHMNKGTFPIRWYLIGPHNRVVDSEDLNDHLRKIRVEAGTALLPTGAIKQIQEEEVSA